MDSYDWTAFGELAQMTFADGNDRDISYPRNLIWDGDAVVEERDDDNRVLRAIGREGFHDASAGITRYFLHDRRGSVVGLVDPSGTVTHRWDYDPWGLPTSGEVAASPLGYAGYYYHAPTGLCLTPTRVYNAAIRRWMSRDPSGLSGGYNLYCYVGDDPVNYVDPHGSECVAVPPFPVLAPGIGALAAAAAAAFATAAIAELCGGGPVRMSSGRGGSDSSDPPIPVGPPSPRANCEWMCGWTYLATGHFWLFVACLYLCVLDHPPEGPPN